jgi:methylmalonyl-CoA carboxyltransferase large subunit
LTDFIIQVRHEGQMYITGPSVIKQVTGEEVTAEELGGVDSHSHYSGVVHFVAESGGEGIAIAHRLLSFLPSNNTDEPPFIEEWHEDTVADDEEMNGIVPENPREAYDMHDVIRRVVDRGDFLEVQEHFAPNLTVGFARVEGSTIGVVANNPRHKAGVLDIDSSSKGARFIRFCNAFNIPLVTFVDVPGFMPGVQQEYGGIIRHGAKMLFAYGAATVPKITVVVRKAYGGAYLAMCGRSMGADRVAAWPSAEIAVMGAEGAVNVLYRKEIKEAADPAAVRAELVAEYTAKFSNPYVAASRGLVDDVIEPADTRAYVALSLEVLKSKREIRPEKKHGLIPL